MYHHVVDIPQSNINRQYMYITFSADTIHPVVVLPATQEASRLINSLTM